MKDQTDYQSLFRTLREAMKAKGYTYSRLAKELGVSEVTVKRIFSSQNCTLERVFSICERLGISFLDVAALAKREEEVDHALTKDQETYFASKPAHFAIFKDLYRGTSPKTIMQEWKLEPARFHKIVRSLEKLGLLEVLPENRMKMNVTGNIRMAHRGPLAKKILRPQIGSFLDHVDRVLEDDDVCMHSAEVELALSDIPEIVEEIHALGAKYRARAFRSKSLLPEKKLKSVRWLLVFAPYRTDWKSYAP